MKKLLLTTHCILAFALIYAQTYPSYNMGIPTSVTDTAGYLYDSGGPNANYSDDSDFLFTITTNNSKPINMHFVLFDMETDVAGVTACAYDYLEVYDGATADPTALIGMYCGNNVPPDFTTSSNTLTIHFISDEGYSTTGFKMFWSTGTIDPLDIEYCDASGNCAGSGMYITDVDLNDLSNTSTCESGGYGDFTDKIANLEINTDYTLEVTVSDALEEVNYTVAWIDFNQDGGFSYDERILLTGDVTGAAAFQTAAVVAPSTAKLGLTRMRIRHSSTPDPVGIGEDRESPCAAHLQGEVEDYSIFITDPANPFPDCPTSVYPADLGTNICTDFNWDWTAATGTNVYYSVELWDNTQNKIIDETNWLSNSYSVSQLTPNTSYTGFLTAYNSNGKSYFCDTISFTTGVANPDVTINERNASICQGSTSNFTLNINNGSTITDYNWSEVGATQLNDSTVASPQVKVASTPGQYALTLILTDDRGCVSNTDSVQFEILTSPNAGVLAIAKPNFCYDERYALVYPDSPNNIYQYSFDGGTNWTTVTPNYVNSTDYEIDLPLPSVLFRVIKVDNFCADTTANVLGEKYAQITHPSIDLTDGDTINCEGDLVTLSVNNYSTSLLWNTNEVTPSIAPTSTDSYQVTYTNNNNCSVSSDSLYIIFNPKPNTPNITFANGQFSIVDNSQHYQWFLDGVLLVEGLSLDTLTPTTNGDYQVLAISSDSCISDTSDSYVLTNVAIHKPHQGTPGMVFYPNPSYNVLYIETPASGKMDIIDLTGKQVHTKTIASGKNKLSLDLPRGVYLIRWNGEYAQSNRLVIL
jgi:hypothetical protein